MEKGGKIIAWTLGIGGALTILFFAGRSIYRSQMQKIMNFCYGLSSYSFGGISATNVNFNVDVEIGNKSDIDFTISKYNFNVTFNGKPIGSIVSNSVNVLVKSKSIATLSLAISFNPTVMLQSSTQNIMAILTASSSIVLGLSGTVSASSLGISVNDYPISLSTTLADISKGGGDGSRKCMVNSQGGLIV